MGRCGQGSRSSPKIIPACEDLLIDALLFCLDCRMLLMNYREIRYYINTQSNWLRYRINQKKILVAGFHRGGLFHIDNHTHKSYNKVFCIKKKKNRLKTLYFFLTKSKTSKTQIWQYQNRKRLAPVHMSSIKKFVLQYNRNQPIINKFGANYISSKITKRFFYMTIL